MQGSKLGLQTWALALYLMSTSLKGASSMALYRALGIRQATAWYLAQRIREGFLGGLTPAPMAGPVEVDETYVGGRLKNMHGAQRRAARQLDSYGKSIVIGARDRATGRVYARVTPRADKPHLLRFVAEVAAYGATVYTDEAAGYRGMPFRHRTVCHSIGHYVEDDCHTNSIESFWTGIKRAHKGTFHKLSPKHLQRYVDEFSWRHNHRRLDTAGRMAAVARGMEGRPLPYRALIASNGLSSFARPCARA